MENEERLATYLENSFLSPLLQSESVTDISYNGLDIYYEDNIYGRKKADIPVSRELVGDFLRQIANFSEKQFSYLNPVLDVSFSKYRLNATFLSVTRVCNKKSYSFSLRIASSGSILDSVQSFFGNNRSKKILLKALEERKSIVIAGETSSGKTELQKWLITKLKEATRVIVIDNVQELELSRETDLDLTSWLVDENNPNVSFASLIRNALRNNPDYLIVAESRGGEMLDALNAVMSGHPIITTIHAKDIESIPYRMGRLAMLSGEKLLLEDTMSDIFHHFSYVVYLKKRVTDDEIFRYIDQIGILNEKTKSIDIVFDHATKRPYTYKLKKEKQGIKK